MIVNQQDRQPFTTYLQEHFDALVDVIANRLRAEISVYDIPGLADRTASGALKTFIEGWHSNQPEAMLKRAVNGIIVGVDYGLTLSEALHIISVFRQTLTHAATQALIASVPAADVGIEYYNALLDQAVEQIGGFYYDKLNQAVAMSDRFRLVIEHAVDAVITSTLSGRINYANPIGLKVLQATSLDDLRDRQLTDLWIDTLVATPQQQLRPAPIETEARHEEGWMQRLDGTRFFAHVASFVIRSNTNEAVGIGMIIRDITAAYESDLHQRQFQQDLLAAHEKALQELAAPLIPLTESTAVVPLIGSLDDIRMQHILPILFQGISHRQFRTVIVDVTGVPVISELVAVQILNAAQTMRLLGTEMLLTGIHPDVAQTLIATGSNLQGIHTFGNLQDGIAKALTARFSALY